MKGDVAPWRSKKVGVGGVAKLSQHQTDGTYYTNIFMGGIVTRQIHPDGVAWLKRQGVQLGGEFPDHAVSFLTDKNWLFTKDEIAVWGEVDWAPEWRLIDGPRPVDPYREYSRKQSELKQQRKLAEERRLERERKALVKQRTLTAQREREAMIAHQAQAARHEADDRRRMVELPPVAVSPDPVLAHASHLALGISPLLEDAAPITAPVILASSVQSDRIAASRTDRSSGDRPSAGVDDQRDKGKCQIKVQTNWLLVLALLLVVVAVFVMIGQG